MNKMAVFIKEIAVSFGKKLATLPLLLVFTKTPVSQDVNHVACPCQHKIKEQFKTYVILWVSYSLIVKQIFTVAKT